MRKQSVKRGVWYIGGRRKRRIQVRKGGGGGLRVGAILGSLASPLLGAVAQQVEENVDVAKWKIIFGEV